ncbi:TVP38/TMEM64 family protein [Pontibacter sp. E15-1]|uniref:TVP38/TMEM64 family protein n=1 Tax=Pontibacter sp. E15-1 TaxID=2919918 RepID=UPI001F502FA9|nr:TVP38/TMEM64 family protein [Pontibacter sp. E15-1]MCJ8166704.1 TVP38/TMEM64 family protein [Pontibacter sp. E15-1]
MTEKKQDEQRLKKQQQHIRGNYQHQPELTTENTVDHKGKNQDEIKESKWPLIITGLLLAAGVAAYFVFPGFQQGVQHGWDVLTSGDEKRISQWVSQFGYWGPFFIVLAMVAQMFLLVINVVALMLVAIIAYGQFWGSLIAIAAVAVASSIGYWIGHGVGEVGVGKLIGQKTERKVTGFVDRYGIWAVMIARISPFLSNDAVSFVAGLAKMGYFKFMAATLAGIVPLTVLLAWLGENNERLKSGLIWVSAVSLGAFVGYIVYDKYIRKSNS